jgi:flavin reductase (DIM6/NTAB) family NADH-FMN oxidoreductase RutF
LRSATLDDFYHYYPTVVAVVTVRAGEETNAMPAAWHSPVSRVPPLYGIAVARKRHSHSLIHSARAFAVNFLPLEKVDLISSFGSSSGRDGAKAADPALWLPPEPGDVDGAPVLADAYAAYQCRLHDAITLGDHDWIVGEIAMVHTVAEAFDADGVLTLSGYTPALYMGKHKFVGPAGASSGS